jgi:hypothetical protein
VKIFTRKINGAGKSVGLLIFWKLMLSLLLSHKVILLKRQPQRRREHNVF